MDLRNSIMSQRICQRCTFGYTLFLFNKIRVSPKMYIQINPAIICFNNMG